MENTNLIVSEITASGSLAEALGISEERAERLVHLIKHAWIDESRISGVIASVSKECTHANELAYVGLIVGRVNSQSNPLLEQLAKRLRGEDSE